MNASADSGLKEELFYLVAYMLTSAQGLYEEPAEYGIFRLLDSAGRLLAILEAHGLWDDSLAHLKQTVDQARTGSMDGERQRTLLQAAVLAAALKLVGDLD